MKGKPLVPFYEGRTREFYKYPMSVFPYLILSEEFDQYEFNGRKYGRAYFEGERNDWFQGIIRDSKSQFHEMVTEFFADASDDDLLRLILFRHGVFNYRFFRHAVFRRVAQRFAEIGFGVEEIRALIGQLSPRKGFQMPRAWYIKMHRDAIFEIFQHLYEQTLLRTIADPYIYKALESWFAEYSQPRKCGLCGDTFRLIDVPMNTYFFSDACQDCCFGCPIVDSPGKSDLMSLVLAFVETCGFIPRSDASPINYGFTSRLSSERKLEAFRAYARMGGIEHVKEEFGSWFEALAKTGALPNGVQPTTRGVRCLASDGHVCHSLDEQYVDNFLSARGIFHEREPYYAPHPELNPHGRRRADWRVGDSFIEYFGLIGDEEYEKRMAEKILLAKHSGVNLIALYPSDLEHLEERVSELK